MGWLSRLFSRKGVPQTTAPLDAAWQKRLDKIRVRLNSLFSELETDENTSRFVTEFVLRAQREVMSGRPSRFRAEDTPERLASEAALQGFLDPEQQGAKLGGGLQDDSLMRILVHYARQGDTGAANAVRHCAAGRLKKRSAGKGVEEALKMARQYAESNQ